MSPIAAQRARNARLTARAEAMARADEVAHPVPGQPAGVPLPVVLLPANTRATTTLPAAAREAFLLRLRGTIRQAFTSPVRDNGAPMSAEAESARQAAQWALPESLPDLPAMLGASCGTCRGECCTAGGTHGFLHADSITRVRAHLTDELGEGDGAVTPASLEALYASHLPARHYSGSCVYHTTAGCALPRALRSNLCNRYVCGGLAQLTRALLHAEVPVAYVASADSVHLRRVARVSAQGGRTLPLSPAVR